MSAIAERVAFNAGFLAAVLWGKAKARLRFLRLSRRGCRDCARWRTALEDARRPLPVADQAPAGPVLPEEEQAERDREREALCDLRMWRAGVSAGKREHGDRLADGLRVGLPDLADADIARVVLRISWYADAVAGEQGDAFDAWAVLLDSLAVAAPDLAAMELELTEGRGR
ncbi:MAG TPA: hypothetical protein VK586_02935 [Streptosporangiaceae bacterium]|nr:hypothetical protein [Streptosporangiaceae bacterium]